MLFFGEWVKYHKQPIININSDNDALSMGTDKIYTNAELLYV